MTTTTTERAPPTAEDHADQRDWLGLGPAGAAHARVEGGQQGRGGGEFARCSGPQARREQPAGPA